mmetsp:Transcript_25275/g.84974  ORF Transcript_25275/g.84974 Transcript_25275/m.84974 type:complete len:206 (+) Transcript_25275:373-990(+)
MLPRQSPNNPVLHAPRRLPRQVPLRVVFFHRLQVGRHGAQIRPAALSPPPRPAHFLSPEIRTRFTQSSWQRGVFAQIHRLRDPTYAAAARAPRGGGQGSAGRRRTGGWGGGSGRRPADPHVVVLQALRAHRDAAGGTVGGKLEDEFRKIPRNLVLQQVRPVPHGRLRALCARRPRPLLRLRRAGGEDGLRRSATVWVMCPHVSAL